VCAANCTAAASVEKESFTAVTPGAEEIIYKFLYHDIKLVQCIRTTLQIKPAILSHTNCSISALIYVVS
jgi:hypothetical protein